MSVIVLGAALAAAPQVRASDASAMGMLKAMSDHIASQKTFSLTFDADIEVITPELQKLQFTSSGEVLLSRPDKLRVRRTGGYADIEFVFDGKALVVHSKDVNAYAQLDAAGTTDNLMERLSQEFLVAPPGADLLASNVYDALSDGVLEARHIGFGVVDGVECDHLAFRNRDTDWQIWIETGARPIPRKYVITSKTMSGAPQYTLRIKSWNASPQVAADAFTFKPEGAASVVISELSGIDEVPPAVTTSGARQ